MLVPWLVPYPILWKIWAGFCLSSNAFSSPGFSKNGDTILFSVIIGKQRGKGLGSQLWNGWLSEVNSNLASELRVQLLPSVHTFRLASSTMLPIHDKGADRGLGYGVDIESTVMLRTLKKRSELSLVRWNTMYSTAAMGSIVTVANSLDNPRILEIWPGERLCTEWPVPRKYFRRQICNPKYQYW